MSDNDNTVFIGVNAPAAPHIVVFRSHRPGFIDTGAPPSVAEVTSLEELLAVEQIARWKQNEKFSGYALSIVEPLPWSKKAPEHHLMATYNEGKEWWVIGYLSDTSKNLGLPVWEQGKPGFIPK